MYLFSALQGHGTSSWPGTRGAPTEWMQGTKLPSPSASSTRWPMRVMVRMLATT
jgi:hypothetical protein